MKPHHFQQALARRPNYPDALVNLGNAWQESRQFEAAIDAFNQYLSLKLDDAGCHYNRGNAYYGKGDILQAIKDFEQAVKPQTGLLPGAQ